MKPRIFLFLLITINTITVLAQKDNSPTENLFIFSTTKKSLPPPQISTLSFLHLPQILIELEELTAPPLETVSFLLNLYTIFQKKDFKLNLYDLSISPHTLSIAPSFFLHFFLILSITTLGLPPLSFLN